MPTEAETVNAFLTAFYRGDFAAARRYVAETYHFRGVFVETKGRDAFFGSAAPLSRAVRGHELKRQWTDGDAVSSFFVAHLETPLGKADVLMAEWDTVRGELLISSVLAFDSEPLRKVMPPRPE